MGAWGPLSLRSKLRHDKVCAAQVRLWRLGLCARRRLAAAAACAGAAVGRAACALRERAHPAV